MTDPEPRPRRAQRHPRPRLPALHRAAARRGCHRPVALILTGFRNAFGLGRSAKSKVLPFILLALNLFPAVILVGVMVLIGARRAADRLRGSTPRPRRCCSASSSPRRRPCCSPATCGTAPSRSTSPARCARRTYALARWTSLLLATLVVPAAPGPAAVRRRAARRARRHRADRERRQGPAVLGLLLALSLTGIAGADRDVVDPARLRRRRHHRRAADRQRHRHRHPGHRRRRGPDADRRDRRAVLAVLPLPRLRHRLRRRRRRSRRPPAPG